MADSPSLDFTLPSATTTANPSKAQTGIVTPDGQKLSFGAEPADDGMSFTLSGFQQGGPVSPPTQPDSTDVIGEITKGISQEVSDVEQGQITKAVTDNLTDLKNIAEAEYTNIGRNNMLVAGVKVLTGTTDYDVTLKTLTDEQTNVQQKLDVLNSQAKAGHADPTLQRFYLQQNINLSNKLSAMAQQQIADSWQLNKDTMAKAGAATLDMVKAFRDHPMSSLKAMGNSLLADPELFALGSVFDAVKGAGTAAKGIVDVTKEGDAAEAAAAGTASASPTQAWTAADSQTVVASQAKVAQALLATHTIASDLRGAGVVLGKVASQAAVFTPLNLVQTWNEKGSIGPQDVTGALASGIGMGAATSAAHWFLKPTGADLNAVLAKADSKTTLNDAVKQLTGVDPLAEARKNQPTVTADGIEVSEHANLSSALDAVAQAGGSYNIHDFINPGVEDEQVFAQRNAMLRIKTDIDSMKANGTFEAGTYEGITPLSDNNIVYTKPKLRGSGFATQISGQELPDGSIRIWHAETAPSYKGQRIGTVGYMKLADRALERGGNLTSDWQVSPAANKVWEEHLPQMGYEVEKSPSARFDPEGNRWITLDGSPVWQVVRKAPDAVKPGEAELHDDYIDLQSETQNLFKQTGAINPKLAAGLAITGGAAAYGYTQGGTKTALEDAALAAVGTIIGPKIIRATAIKGAGTLSATNSAFKTLDDLNGELTSLPLMASHVRNNINNLVPDSENLYNNLVKSVNAKPMTENEQAAYTIIHGLLNKMGARAKDAGAIQSLIQDYFTRWWEPTPGSPLEEDWGKIRLRKSRTLTNGSEGLAQAHAMGLKPKTTNVGDLMQHYILGMHRATILRETAEALKNTTDASGEGLVVPRMKAPKNYLPMKGLLANYSAHPDIAVLGNMLFDMPEPGMIGKYYDLLNYGLKRTVLSFTLFHPKNLAMNFLMAGGHPGEIPTAFNPNSEFQQALQHGGSNPGADYIHYAARSGLELSIDKTPEDYGNDAFYKPLDAFSNKLDSYMPGLSAAPKAITGLSHLNDKISFQLAQNYFKFNTWSRTFEKSYGSALNKHLTDPDHFPMPNKDEHAQRAAVVANDLFGGQNYYQTIRQMKPGWTQQVMGNLLNPSNRRVLQRLVLAPDWTLSVARSFTRAFTAQGAKAAYGRYLLGAGAMYLAAAVTQNLVTGKYPWETGTKPGYITWQDGSTTQWDKQVAEAGEWIESPGQALLNKQAMIPRFLEEDIFNEQYLSTKGAPPIHPKDASDWLAQDLLHNVKQSGPIGVQQASQANSFAEGAGSFFGFPTYSARGKTISRKESPWEVMQRERTRRTNKLRGFR